MQGNCNLSRLRLSGNKIGDSGAMLLALTLQGNDSLTELELAACDLVHVHAHTHTEIHLSKRHYNTNATGTNV